MLRKIREWFITRAEPLNPSPLSCPACTGELELCPRCEGDWQTTACLYCRLGYICSTCHLHWVTT